jgi:hypothetical protein
VALQLLGEIQAHAAQQHLEAARLHEIEEVLEQGHAHGVGASRAVHAQHQHLGLPDAAPCVNVRRTSAARVFSLSLAA